VIVPGSFANQLMLTYKLEGERAGAGRDLRQHQPDTAALRALWLSGHQVVAFTEARTQLERIGAVLEPVALRDEPLPELLDALPPGRVVAIAGVGLGVALAPATGPSLPQIGGRTSLFGRRRDEYAIVGVTGAGAAAVEAAGADVAVRASRSPAIRRCSGWWTFASAATSATSGGRTSRRWRRTAGSPSESTTIGRSTRASSSWSGAMRRSRPRSLRGRGRGRRALPSVPPPKTRWLRWASPARRRGRMCASPSSTSG
jgi:hypothetical protein